MLLVNACQCFIGLLDIRSVTALLNELAAIVTAIVVRRPNALDTPDSCILQHHRRGLCRRSSTCSSCATTWLIDTYELIYKVIEALLVISLRKLLVPIVIKILMQNLLQVLVQLLSL